MSPDDPRPEGPSEKDPSAQTPAPPAVAGYTALSTDAILLVNKIKQHEERIMRAIDHLQHDPEVDQRWLAIARTQLQQSYMCLVRSIFKPARLIVLDPDMDLD